MSDTTQHYDASLASASRQPNIVSLSRYKAEPTLTILNDVVAYWQRLRQGVAVPRRTDIDPRAIKPHLEHAFILERVAPGLARFRVAGRSLNAIMGMDARGMTISAVIENGDRTEFSTALEEVFQGPSKITLTLTISNQPGIRARLCLMPLKSDLGDISRALGVIEVQGTIAGPTPHRFQIQHIDRTPLLGDAPKADPVSPPPLRAQPKADEPAADQATASAKPAPVMAKDATTEPRNTPLLASNEDPKQSDIRNRIAKHRRAMLRVIDGGV